jgi:glutaredoxin
MGRLLIILGLFIGLSQLSFVQDVMNPPRDFSTLKYEPVVLYSTSWCGYCAKTRRFFEKNKINYVEYDIEKSVAAKREYDNLDGGGVPLVLVDRQLVRGYNPSKVVQFLDEFAVKTNQPAS